MAFNMWTSNKRAGDTTSYIKFSTGKDMCIGEALDLTAPELAEMAPYCTFVPGTNPVAITAQNFPPVIRITRATPTAPLTTTKH